MTDEVFTPAAGSGLAPGDAADPRDGPFTPEELAEASDAVFVKDRWIVKQDKRKVDVLALRLQVGRGRPYKSICEQFGIVDSTLLKRRRRDRDADSRRSDWPTSLSERDRRHMARRIHLAGLARRLDGQDIGDAELKAMSEWRAAPPPKPKPIWTSLGDDGPRAPDTLQETCHDFEDDPYIHERRRLREQLDALIRDMERNAAGRIAGHGLSDDASRDDAAGGSPLAPGAAAEGSARNAAGEAA